MEGKPQRIRLSRKAGFNLQEASIMLNGLPAMNCARPGPYGNRYRIGKSVQKVGGDTLYMMATVEDAIAAFKADCERWRAEDPKGFDEWIAPLRTHNAACWCRAENPCHCSVLLTMAQEGIVKTHAKEWPRIRDLPEKLRAPFEKWMAGQTVPHLDGVPMAEQDGYFPWDYERWKSQLRGEHVVWD